MHQTITMQVSQPSDPAARRVALRSLRALGAAIDRAFSALVKFWSVPVIGESETRESRYFRTRQYI